MEFQFNGGKDDSALGQLDKDPSRTRRARSFTKKEKKIKIKAKAIDDLLYSSGTQVVVRKELDQYCHLFKSITKHHEEYCNLLDAENQRHERNYFDDLDQDVFNFKHKV